MYQRPASIFVAGFIGSPAINFLPARADGTNLALANGGVVGFAGGQNGDVILGVRPESLVPDADGPLRVVVDLTEQLGATTLLHGRLEGAQTEIVVSLPGLVTVDSGTVMGFSAPVDALHLFDEKTEKRLETGAG